MANPDRPEFVEYIPGQVESDVASDDPETKLEDLRATGHSYLDRLVDESDFDADEMHKLVNDIVIEKAYKNQLEHNDNDVSLGHRRTKLKRRVIVGYERWKRGSNEGK